MSKKLNYRWLLLILGTFCLLFAGIIYAWSILKIPLSSEFGWSAGDMATNYTITISFFCIGCIAGGFMMRLFSPKIPVILGGILVGLGFYMTSRLDGGSISSLFIFYGIIAGLGIGMAYNTILASVGAWFPDKKGFASGCLMMGFGASTLVLGNLAAQLIMDSNFGWRKVFVCLAIVTALLLIIMGVFICMPPKDTDLPKSPSSSSSVKNNSEITDYSTIEMVKRISFWKFFVAMLLIGAAGSSVISFANDFAQSAGASAALAGLFVGILSIFNGIGRIIAGMISDRFGRKACVIYVGIVTIAANVLCLLSAAVSSVPLCLIGFCAIGLSYGGNTNVVSIIISAFYGNKYYAQNLSLGLLTLLPASFLSKLSTTLLVTSGGYIIPFAVLVLYAIISMILNMTNNKP